MYSRWHTRDAWQRPPWWPAEEPWPPRGAWRMRGRMFLRRLAIIFVSLVGFVWATSIISWLVFRRAATGGGDHNTWDSYGGPPVIMLIFLVGAGYIAWRLLRRTTRPVEEIMEATGRLAEGDYSVRVRAGGAPEMRDLAYAFNALAARLERNETQRRDLIADVTHELRTPLSIIRGTAEGIADGVYAADAAHVAPIVDEATIMARLIDDLGTLSTLEAGQLSLHFEDVEPHELVADAAESFRERFEAAGVRLETAVADGLPALSADSMRLRQVLSNLLTNALRHTPVGGSVRVEAAASAEARVVFRVVDTGSGIAPEDLPFVFDRFRKAGDSTGSGLGLAIARSLVEAHGGSIGAESAAGRGTTVTIELPAPARPA